MSYAPLGIVPGTHAAVQAVIGPVCEQARLMFNPSTLQCVVSNGKMLPVAVPPELAWYVYWRSLVCAVGSGGYPRATGMPDKVREITEIGCCTEDADMFCDSWHWRSEQ